MAFQKTFIINNEYFVFPHFWTGFRRHQVASTDPEMFIHGPNIAGANAALALYSTPIAFTKSENLSAENRKCIKRAPDIIFVKKRSSIWNLFLLGYMSII